MARRPAWSGTARSRAAGSRAARPSAALALLLAGAALVLAAGRAGASADSGPAQRSILYRLRAEGLSDSLQAAIGDRTADSARTWTGSDLETAANRLRDLLAARGDVAATVRLELVRGAGSAPGTARLLATRPARGDGAGGVAPPSLRAVAGPVVHSAVPIEAALGDSVAAAYRAASRGSASTEGVAAGLSAARDALIDAGYFAAEVALDSIEVEASGARAHLEVLAGSPAVFESMELPGATATRPKTAARAAGLVPGERLNPTILASARERLAASGLFEEVGDPRLSTGGAPGAVRVVVPVVEEHASRFEGALGVAREGGVTGLLDLALGNIAGSGRSAGLRWFGPGNGRSEYAARYREPALFGTRSDASIALEAQVADSLFTQTRWSAEVGYAPGAASRASLAIVKSGSTYSGLARGSSSTWSLAARGALDRLRPSLNPMQGMRASLAAEAGRRSDRVPGAPTEVRGLFRGTASLEGALPLSARRVIAASARASGAFLPGGGFPADELLFVGGSEGLRGHRDRAYGGSRIAAASLEHRWITDDRGGRLYLFADLAGHDLNQALAAGSAALSSSSETGSPARSLARTVLSPGLQFGYGAGLRTRMASGLVGLELGFAPGEPLRRGTIHVRYASTW